MCIVMSLPWYKVVNNIVCHHKKPDGNGCWNQLRKIVTQQAFFQVLMVWVHTFRPWVWPEESQFVTCQTLHFKIHFWKCFWTRITCGWYWVNLQKKKKWKKPHDYHPTLTLRLTGSTILALYSSYTYILTTNKSCFIFHLTCHDSLTRIRSTRGFPASLSLK